MKLSTIALALAGIAGAPALAQTREAADRDVVVVTATRSEESLLDVPASVASKDIDELRKLGFTYGSEEFRGVPGIFVRRGEGDGDEFLFVSIRGSSGTEGYLALIDGVPFLGPDEEPLLNQIPYDALQRVEVVKGPVSTLYGRGGLYGAVNYITREPSADRTDLSVTAGSDDYYRAAGVLERKFDGGSALLSASYEDYKGWREHGGKKIFNLFGRVRTDLTEATRVDASLNYFDRDSEVPNGLPMTPEGDLIPVAGGAKAFLGYGNPRNVTQGTIGSVRIEHDFDDRLTGSFVVQARRFDQELGLNFYDSFGLDMANTTLGFNGFYTETTQDVVFAEGTLAYQADGHSIIAGVSGEQARSKSADFWSGQNGFTPECGFTFYLVQIDYSTGQLLNGNHPCFVVDAPVSRDRFDNTFWGAFIQDEIRLTDNWRLTLGLRYDAFKRDARVASPTTAPFSELSGDADAISPKASLSYLYDGGQLYVAYGRGFNSNFGTTFEWDALRYARPENKPSTIDSIEIGWKGETPDETIGFELAAFYSEQTNRRQFIPNPDAAVDPTAPGDRIVFGTMYVSQGIEASIQWRPWDGAAFTAQYSWLDPHWDDYVIESAFAPTVDLSGTTPTGVAKNIFYLSAEQRFTPWLTARASFEAYGDYMVTQSNNIRKGSHELLNVGATLEHPDIKNVAVDLAITNALGEDYYYYFGGRTDATAATPGVPRQFRATVRTSF